jgi:hypothetical protein
MTAGQYPLEEGPAKILPADSRKERKQLRSRFERAVATDEQGIQPETGKDGEDTDQRCESGQCL